MIITVDGPAGTGKSTVAKKVADRLSFTFFDTGAMFRAVTLVIQNQHIPYSDEERIEQLLKHFHFRIETTAGQKRYFVGNQEVTNEIRSQIVTRHVSEVAALKVVRDSLKNLQRRFATDCNAVFEGRDMGSHVFPQAELKIFLTASKEVRAERRFRELLLSHPSEAENMTLQQVFDDLVRRDQFDSSRELAPLRPAEDALVIDTSDLSIEEVVEKIIQLFQGLIR